MIGWLPSRMESPGITLLTPLVLGTMAVACGLCVANIYYCQPLLHQMKMSFSCTEREIGWVAALTQFGYAFGMLLFIPLGDMFERRKLITLFTALGALALIGMGVAPTLAMVYLMSFLVGITTMTPQLVVPFAAQLAPEKKRGQVVGIAMGGLSAGLVLGRTIAGFGSLFLGWRGVYWAMAFVSLFFAMFTWRIFPSTPSTFRGNYRQILKSVFENVRSQPVLREVMFFGALLFGAFSAFWATLIHHLESDSFHLGAGTVGSLALFGVVSAFASTITGREADRRDPRHITGFAIITMVLSFLVALIWGKTSLIGLSLGVLLLSIGSPCGMVSNQSRMYALSGEARSRLNTAYMTSYFGGGALGSLLATWAWSLYRWDGVCWVSLGMLLIAGIQYFRGLPRSSEASITS